MTNLLRKIRGMKFPDLYIIKFFFKENLDKIKGRVIEFGCGNGNNLWLFYSYGYDVCGIDKDEIAIMNATFNFGEIFVQKGVEYKFIHKNIDNYDEIKAAKLLEKKFNVLLLPNVVSYIKKDSLKNLLKEIGKILENKGKVFVRFRSPRDMRIVMGEKIREGEYILRSDLTGEENLLLTVYEESEMLNLLSTFLKIKNYKIFHLYEENYHGNRKILNADVVIWGDYEV